MNRKGILLAGGSGNRLWPSTKVVNKHLLNVFDKPLIYYSLTTLMLADVREVLLISSPSHQSAFEQLLGDGSQLGMNIEYATQGSPLGVAEAPIIAANFLNGASVVLMLGDNILHGVGLGRQLRTMNPVVGAELFGYRVNNPSAYGVAVFDESGALIDIVEKPTSTISDVAIPGLYFFDSTVVSRAKELAPSARGELEITDLNRSYLESGSLSLHMMSRGNIWLDAGTPSDLHESSEFVRITEQRQGIKMGCPEEVAWRNGWIDDNDLLARASEMPPGQYSNYLLGLLTSNGEIPAATHEKFQG